MGRTLALRFVNARRIAGEVACMGVLQPEHTLSNAVEALLADGEGEIVSVDAAGTGRVGCTVSRNV